MYYFYKCRVGGNIKRLDSLSHGGEDNQGGGARYPWTACPPGGKPTMVGLAPRGTSCPGGKINWDTGIRPIVCPCSAGVLVSHLNSREKQLGLKSTLFGMHIYLHITQSLFNF